jgi:transposase, IS30 family
MGTKYSHISDSHRMTIQSLLLVPLSCRAIALELGYHHASICREVSRGKPALGDAAARYQTGVAAARARAGRASAGAKRRKLGSDTSTLLWRTVLKGLRCNWSPEQIAGTLPRMNKPFRADRSATAVAPLGANHTLDSSLLPLSDKPCTQRNPPSLTPALTVSHETIYCAIYAMPRGTLRTELISLLRKSHKARLPRARGSQRKGGLPNMKNIALRPPEVAARIVPGHWEGDLIKGAMNRSSVGTLVERTSRYVMLVKLDGGCALDILEGFERRLKSIPESLRKTMTYDQGSEMALHETLSKQLHMDIFFCDPHSPWQRGSNENANGLIREYLPKGMDLSTVSHQQLTAIEHALNNRPRKILGFQTPHEVFSQLRQSHTAGVALQA